MTLVPRTGVELEKQLGEVSERSEVAIDQMKSKKIKEKCSSQRVFFKDNIIGKTIR